MDFIGNEDSTRYALEIAFRQHIEDVKDAKVALNSLPHAGIARLFLEELDRRGWKVVRK